MIKIGLFPLNIVMFPEAYYPLHIFEERYKVLVKECYGTGHEFGINYFSNTGISQTGCSVLVNEISKTYSDGKMDVIVQGISRYRIIKIIDGEKPYFTAEVEPFADDDFDIDANLLEEATRLFNKVIEGITSIKIDPIYPDKITVKYPSFLIAQKAGFSPQQKQSLIEIRSENLRLKALSAHLRKVQPLIKKAEVISNIVKNDGYLNLGAF
jgi:uncharacterized protein